MRAPSTERLPVQHTPLISIVTPSYNQGQFIRETITSVLDQSYPHLELWVMDGGSSDNTIEILRSFEGDPRFHWVSERDRGQSDAINKGLARCTGEVFAWLNSDDLLTPGALAAVTEACGPDRRAGGALRARAPYRSVWQRSRRLPPPVATSEPDRDVKV